MRFGLLPLALLNLRVQPRQCYDQCCEDAAAGATADLWFPLKRCRDAYVRVPHLLCSGLSIHHVHSSERFIYTCSVVNCCFSFSWSLISIPLRPNTDFTLTYTTHFTLLVTHSEHFFIMCCFSQLEILDTVIHRAILFC